MNFPFTFELLLSDERKVHLSSLLKGKRECYKHVHYTCRESKVRSRQKQITFDSVNKSLLQGLQARSPSGISEWLWEQGYSYNNEKKLISHHRKFKGFLNFKSLMMHFSRTENQAATHYKCLSTGEVGYRRNLRRHGHSAPNEAY